MKIIIWANSPSPHQSDFYQALIRKNVDLQVVYYNRLSESRQKLGWSQDLLLGQREFFCDDLNNPLNSVPDWQSAIHLIPGYSKQASRTLVRTLSDNHVPWVHWSESSMPSWRSNLTWLLKKWYAKQVNSHALGAFSQGILAEADFIRWGINQDKIAHLFYAVEGEEGGASRDEITARFVGNNPSFIFVGSFIPLKQCDKLLRAFATARSINPSAKLVLVGHGAEREKLMALCEQLKICDHVLFRGVLSIRDIQSVMRCAHCLVLPSRYDGWGVVMNEAASNGLALIATDQVGAAHHLIKSGWNGIRVKAKCIPSLSAALKRYMNDPVLMAIHGQRSCELFQEFTPERNAERFCNTIAYWLTDPRWAQFRSDCCQISQKDYVTGHTAA